MVATHSDDPPACGDADERSFQVEAQGHTLAFYPDGPGRLAALLELIGSAARSLKVCFYIYAPDDSGRRVRDALVAAAGRGVEVSLIVDGFGADADADFFAPLVEQGGRFCSFSPRWNLRYLIRNHQKIVVADGRLAMLGGFNVEDGYFAPSDREGWEDLAFTVTGPIVGRIGQWFDELEDWAKDPQAQFRSIRRKVRAWDAGAPPVQLLIGGPTRGLSSWARCVARDFAQGDRLDLIMAYFSPSPRLLRRMRRIARRGQTRLVMAAKSDNGATVGAARALYRRLLRAGAQIWEFEPRMLHTKLIVLDDAVYLGSANFDMRSLYLNLEIMLRIEDAGLAARMRAFVSERIDRSVQITPELNDRRATIWRRIRWRASWFLVAVVDYTVSRRLNLGL
jgi:cardiolipin synthase